MDCGSGWNGVKIQPGDTIVFKGGDSWIASTTHSDNCIGWAPTFSGTAGNPITLKGDPTWYTGGSFTRPIFDGVYLPPVILYLDNVSYINVDNIEFKRVLAPKPDNSGLIHFSNAHHLNFSNLYLHGWRLAGSGMRLDGAQGGIIGWNYLNKTTDAPTVTM